jgi:hypothetical protein
MQEALISGSFLHLLEEKCCWGLGPIVRLQVRYCTPAAGFFELLLRDCALESME